VFAEKTSWNFGTRKELSNLKQKLTEVPDPIPSNRKQDRIVKSESSEADGAKNCKDCTYTSVYGTRQGFSPENSKNEPTYDQKCST
jgi:hypothetical protein